MIFFFQKIKRGNIPITLLVIGVFALCAFALLSFFISDFKVSNSFVGVDILHKVNSDIDGFYFYKRQGVSSKNLEQIFKFLKEDDKDYIYIEKTIPEGLFIKKETFLFSVKYPIALEKN